MTETNEEVDDVKVESDSSFDETISQIVRRQRQWGQYSLRHARDRASIAERRNARLGNADPSGIDSISDAAWQWDLDQSFECVKEWINEFDKQVQRKLRGSDITTEKVAQLGTLLLTHLKQTYPTADWDSLRPMMSALLHPLEYALRFGHHPDSGETKTMTVLYWKVSEVATHASRVERDCFGSAFYAANTDKVMAEVIFAALREATRTRPDPSYQPGEAWHTVEEDMVRTSPVALGKPDELLADLDKMTGLDAVKKVVHQQAKMLQFQEWRAKEKLATPSQNRHILFRGNPGTGKTTVARIIAGIYRAMGIVDNEYIVEVDSSGLVSQWRGKTPGKTNAAVNEALGGILFVDEAYALATQEGQQAIDTLIKRMEDDRDDLVVILAGYPDKMDELLATNPGIDSRIGLTIDFPDYTDKELISILGAMVHEQDFVIDSGAVALVQNQLPTLNRSKDFGNARVVRNIVEATVRAQSERVVNEVTRQLNANPNGVLAEPGREQLMKLTQSDVQNALDQVFQASAPKVPTGFGH